MSQGRLTQPNRWCMQSELAMPQIDHATHREQQRRVIYLDALRGVAIVLVMAYHVCTRFGDSVAGVFSSVFGRTGWAGVDIFYAISGFLITRILIADHEAGRLPAFFVKRFFRIVPLYFVAVLAYVSVSLVTGFERELLERIWVTFLFLTAWLIPFLGENGVPYTISWSVSVEESAYLLFGMVSLWGFVRFRKVLWLIVGAALLLRVAVVFGNWFDSRLLYYFVPARIDTIAIGGLFAIAGADHARRSSYLVAACATAASIFAFGFFGKQNAFLATVGYTVLGVAAARLVFLLATRPRGGEGLVARLLAKIGEVSYFIYLFHMFVIGGFAYVLPQPWQQRLGFLPLFVAVLLVTYTAARISWAWFEFPLISYGRRLANRYCPARSPISS